MLCTWRLCHSVVEAGTLQFPESAQDWQDGLGLVLLAHSVVSNKAIKSHNAKCLKYLSVCGRILPRFNSVSVFDLMQYAKTNHKVSFRIGEGGRHLHPWLWFALPWIC